MQQGEKGQEVFVHLYIYLSQFLQYNMYNKLETISKVTGLLTLLLEAGSFLSDLCKVKRFAVIFRPYPTLSEHVRPDNNYWHEFFRPYQTRFALMINNYADSA
jgi:hypothetical protein